MSDLEAIYRRTLELCAPEVLVRKWRTDNPVCPFSLDRQDCLSSTAVVAIGKCAGGLLDGVGAGNAFAVLPRGYPPPKSKAEVHFGAHPLPDESSFEAGARLLDFVRQHDDVLFLISGGGSACVEAPLEPWFTREDIVETHRRLLDAGLPIAQMNIVRKQLSAIKGGRLAAAVRGRSETVLYSDVGTGDIASVASGPTVPDASARADAIRILERIGGCDRIVTKLRDETLPGAVHTIDNTSWSVVADNATLVRTAADLLGDRAVVIDRQIEGDVQQAADCLAAEAARLSPGEVLVAGGEPTVVMRGSGKGGRCLELAVRFARKSPASALFGSSDGVDGNSGVAGAIVDRRPADGRRLTDALQRSDTLSVIDLIGRPIIIPPTGNNLRDLYLMARS